jgi:hypothetical protein
VLACFSFNSYSGLPLFKSGTPSPFTNKLLSRVKKGRRAKAYFSSKSVVLSSIDNLHSAILQKSYLKSWFGLILESLCPLGCFEGVVPASARSYHSVWNISSAIPHALMSRKGKGNKRSISVCRRRPGLSPNIKNPPSALEGKSSYLYLGKRMQ